MINRRLLTIPVTVASSKLNFSKLKLLKSYLRSTMTQERLNDLAMIAFVSDMLEKIDYELKILFHEKNDVIQINIMQARLNRYDF
jgi:hypothetical protein